MFTNTYPAFCRENVRCKVKGGSEQQRARFYRGASFRMPFLADFPFDAIMNEIIENLRIEKGAFA